MDQLDILKSRWQSQESSLPKFSKKDIKGLLHHKSSGIVKSLLLVAIGEFVFFAFLGFAAHLFNQDHDFVEIFGPVFYYGSSALHYAVIFIFMYLFYQNYVNISADQPSRSLMKNILKTRRTMKAYIWYNLIYIMVVGMWAAVLAINNDPNFQKIKEEAFKGESEIIFTATVLAVCFVTYSVICVILFLIYQLIYGILLRRLKENYYELKKMEV